MTESRPTARITGAARGIGRAIALRLAPRWSIVALARTAPELGTLSAEIEKGGGTCERLVMDVTDGRAVRGALEGREVDIVVNNAGVGVLKPFVELTADE